MTLYLLKDPINPVALRILSSQPPAQTAPPVVVLLSPGDTVPPLPGCTVYRAIKNGATPNSGTVSYDRLVSLLFEADRVVTW